MLLMSSASQIRFFIQFCMRKGLLVDQELSVAANRARFWQRLNKGRAW